MNGAYKAMTGISSSRTKASIINGINLPFLLAREKKTGYLGDNTHARVSLRCKWTSLLSLLVKGNPPARIRAFILETCLPRVYISLTPRK